MGAAAAACDAARAPSSDQVHPRGGVGKPVSALQGRMMNTKSRTGRGGDPGRRRGPVRVGCGITRRPPRPVMIAIPESCRPSQCPSGSVCRGASGWRLLTGPESRRDCRPAVAQAAGEDTVEEGFGLKEYCISIRRIGCRGLHPLSNPSTPAIADGGVLAVGRS
jgi:hypothetical protein